MIPRLLIAELELDARREPAPALAGRPGHLQRVRPARTPRAPRESATSSKRLPLHRRQRARRPFPGTEARVLEFVPRCPVCAASPRSGCAHRPGTR